MFSKAQIKQISNIISNNVERKFNAVFFEKRKSGMRSIKVWFWTAEQYSTIIADLQAAGYNVKLVQLKNKHYAMLQHSNLARLHVSV